MGLKIIKCQRLKFITQFRMDLVGVSDGITPRFHFKAQVFAQPPGTEFMGKFVDDKNELKNFITGTPCLPLTSGPLSFVSLVFKTC